MLNEVDKSPKRADILISFYREGLHEQCKDFPFIVENFGWIIWYHEFLKVILKILLLRRSSLDLVLVENRIF